MVGKPLSATLPKGGVRMKSDTNPMNLVELMNNAPRCTAKSKRSGKPCKAPAVKGWTVCRFHGAGGGHGSGKANPAYKHGARSASTTAMRKVINDLVRMTKG